jgi:hypothetical protein
MCPCLLDYLPAAAAFPARSFPGDAESVTALLRSYGDVRLVRICSKDTRGKLPVWLTVGRMGRATRV